MDQHSLKNIISIIKGITKKTALVIIAIKKNWGLSLSPDWDFD
jgi:hypothetical protein